MIDVAPYVAAAAAVGILHMSAPDHWVTLCVMGKNLNWTRRRTFGVSLATASGHVFLSVLLGLSVVVVGLVFSRLVSVYLDLGIGIVMVAVGLFVGIRPFLAANEKSDGNDASKTLEAGTAGRDISYFAVLGAALSPDLSITPVFLSAVPTGIYLALELALVFAAASILTLLVLVQVGTMGLGKVFERIPEKYNDSLVGFVIAVVGAYIIVVG